MKNQILIVDDSTTLGASVDFTLSGAGYTVLQASDGRKGLAALKHMRTDELGMIITDVNMPNMDGLTFVREVKKTGFKFVPILVLTTESENGKKLEGKAAGASGWLVKPFQPDQLLSVVRKFVS